MGIKEILLKLAGGENYFDCSVYGQKRTCKVLKIDLWGLVEDKGRVLVKLSEPVKKMSTKRVENTFSLDDYSFSLEDVEVDVNEVWLNVGY